MAGGVLVGMLGWFVPEVLGVGYGQVGKALNGQLALQVMILLVALKLLATAACYASGNAGGIFGPSLFLGAMLGGAFGSVTHSLFPDYTGSIGAYALVGMGTTFAGIIRVPLTSVIMIFEITRDYSIVVPLMISTLLAYFISYKLQREPIYEALQHQEGIHLPSFVKQRAGILLVRQAMRPPSLLLWTIQSSDKVSLPQASEENAIPLLDQEGLVGMLPRSQLEKFPQHLMGEKTLGEITGMTLPALPLTADNFPHVHEDHPLDTVLKRMAETGLKTLPVVDRSNLRELQGVISLRDVLAAYGLEEGVKPASPAEKVAAISPLPALAWLSVSLLTLLLLIGLFVYQYRSQRQAAAVLAFQQGKALVAQGRNEEAIEQFRNALSVSHANEHRLALALSLEKVARFNEAKIYLDELAKVDSNNTLLNLGLARYEAHAGNFQEARSYYHRSIYGTWPTSMREISIQVRFELIEYLGKNEAQKQALTELMALAEILKDNVPQQKRIGKMLLDYGGAAESAGIFRELLRRGTRDAESLAGLGLAEFAQSDYGAAQVALKAALQLSPQDPLLKKRLEICDQINLLNPTLRGLAAAERFKRSQNLLEKALQWFESCHAPNTEPIPSVGGTDPVAMAHRLLTERTRASHWAERTEARLDAIEQLYQIGKTSCGPPSDSQEAIRRILDKLFPQ
jgi:CBS domain-containing protein